MPQDFDVLPAEQRRLLAKLASLRELGFVLYGGTAIALQIGHCVSIDFDFFCDRSLDRSAIVRAVPALDDAPIVQDESDTWTLLSSDPESGRQIKTSFFGGLSFGRVGEPLRYGAINLASLDDLLGHKLEVLLQRVEVKDYQDIVAILKAGLTLEQGIGAAVALFPNLPASEALKALVYFSDADLSALGLADRNTLIDHVDNFSIPIKTSIVARRLAP